MYHSRKVLIAKINTSIWLCCKIKKSLMEDKRNNKVQRPHAHWNRKRHVSLVSLLLCHKMVAVCCFIWALGLQLWSRSEWVSERVREMKFQVLAFEKNSTVHPATSKCLMFLISYFMLDGLLYYYDKVIFVAKDVSMLEQSPLKTVLPYCLISVLFLHCKVILNYMALSTYL